MSASTSQPPQTSGGTAKRQTTSEKSVKSSSSSSADTASATAGTSKIPRSSSAKTSTKESSPPNQHTTGSGTPQQTPQPEKDSIAALSAERHASTSMSAGNLKGLSSSPLGPGHLHSQTTGTSQQHLPQHSSQQLPHHYGPPTGEMARAFSLSHLPSATSPHSSAGLGNSAGPIGFLELIDPNSYERLEKSIISKDPSARSLSKPKGSAEADASGAASGPTEKKKKKQLVSELEELHVKLTELQFQYENLRTKNYSLTRENERWRRLWMMTVGAEPSIETSRQLQGSAACWAASIGSVPRLKTMLEYGGDVYLQDADGRTALHMAVSENQLETCKFLLQCGADLSKMDRWGDTPLTIAIGLGLTHGPVAELLEVAETTMKLKELESEISLANYMAIGDEESQLLHIPRIQKKISKFIETAKQPSPPTTMNAKSGPSPTTFGQGPLSPLATQQSSPSLLTRNHYSEGSSTSTSAALTDAKVPPLARVGSLATSTGTGFNSSAMVGAALAANSGRKSPLSVSSGSIPSLAEPNAASSAPRSGSKTLSVDDDYVSKNSRGSREDLWSSTAKSSGALLTSPPAMHKSKDKKDKEKKRKSTNRFFNNLIRNLLRDSSDDSDSGQTSGAAGKMSGKSKQTNAPFGVVHGVLRGACQVPDCDCKSFKKPPSGASTTCSCGHFPASHLNLGEADMLEGLGHLKVVDEASIAVLVPKDMGAGSDSWPRVFNSNLQGDEDSEILRQMWNGQHAQWVINPQELTFNRQIGAGTSATVYEGLYKDKIVAIKLISFKPSDKRPREKQRQELIEEFNVMTSIVSPHIVQFYGVVVEPRLCLVIEFCNQGALYDVISRGASADDSSPPASGPGSTVSPTPSMTAPDSVTPIPLTPAPSSALAMDWRMVFKWFKEAVEGVNALHQRRPPIVHRDLKTLNLLIDSDNVVKVADFGLSRFLNSEDQHQTTLAKLRGTYAYCSPEVYFGEFFSPKSDVYSLGVILWELVTRLVTGKYYRPYADYAYIQFDFQIIIQAAKKFCRPTIPPETPAEVASLIRLLWSPKPESRPDCATLLQMMKTLETTYEQHKEDWDKLVGTGQPLQPLRTAPQVVIPPEWSLVPTHHSGSSTSSEDLSTSSSGSGRSGSLSESGSTTMGAYISSGGSKAGKRRSDHKPSKSRDDSMPSPRSGSTGATDERSSSFTKDMSPLVSAGSSSNLAETGARASKASRLLGTSGSASKTVSEKTLHDVLLDANLFNEFKAFMAARYNSENLLFWEEVSRFRIMCEDAPPEKTLARATDIYKKYITGEKFNQQYVVSISPASTRELTKVFKDPKNIDALTVFNQAYDEVEHVTLKPSFADFIRHHAGN